MPFTTPSRPLRLAAATLAIIATVFLLLAIPLPGPTIAPAPAGGGGFVWNRDSVWKALESRFAATRAAGCADSLLAWTRVAALQGLVEESLAEPVLPEAAVLDTLEARFFGLSPLVAACPAALPGYLELDGELRRAIKQQSVHWNLGSRVARDRLYRALYGGRAAVEEVMLQHPDQVESLRLGTDEPSASPGAVARGVTLHSGDIIVSRGGYPTSALIARGNDYPGNFSHVALVHVDETSHLISVIEAHIEAGVAVAPFESYLADKKLRLLLLRPRADLPALQADPLLPHRAASGMLDRARAGHIPYDFAMDYHDPTRLFCSEVASSAYHEHGLDLWAGISTISSEGLRRWLGSFGVEHFETQEPSDLEYDPQLVVVAEWRDPASLFEDHLGNAVTDVMLEGAERGDDLTFAWHALPLARLAKGYSWLLERLGGIGPIPEGMTAAAALRNRNYSARHAEFAAAARVAADAWQAERGYPPAYWTLVELARTVQAGQ